MAGGITRLKGRVALVTGAAGALGSAIADRLAIEGATVVRTDLRVTDDLDAPGGPVLQHDVVDPAAWERVIAITVQRCGGLDAIVNNAGLANLPEAQDPESVTLEHWRAVNSINVEGVLLGCQAGMRAMKERGGAIVNISSLSALQPSPKMAAYGASKAAVRHLTTTVAAHCAQRGYKIRCNSIHPGWVPTDMTRGARTPEELAAQEHAIPMGRFGTPEEIASVVAFLCSDDSAYMTGAKLAVDGGIAMQ